MLPIKHEDVFSKFDDIFDGPFSMIFDQWPFGLVTKTDKPAMDVTEVDDHFEVTADVPGFSKSDLKISYEGGVITVSGKRDTKFTGKRALTERVTSFSRSIALPDNANFESAKAELKDGVIKITVPKTETTKPRNNIEIE